MTNNKHNELMESISSIYNISKGSKMRKDLFNEIEKELSVVAEYLETGNQAAFLFSNIVPEKMEGEESMSLQSIKPTTLPMNCARPF